MCFKRNVCLYVRCCRCIDPKLLDRFFQISLKPVLNLGLIDAQTVVLKNVKINPYFCQIISLLFSKVGLYFITQAVGPIVDHNLKIEVQGAN